MKLKYVPFSMRGSYIAVSHATKDIWGKKLPEKGEGVYLRYLSGRSSINPNLFKIEISQDFSEDFHPHLLRLKSKNVVVEMVFESPECLRIRGHGSVEISNAQKGCIFLKRNKKSFVVNFPLSGIDMTLDILNGDHVLKHEWNGMESSCRLKFKGNFEIALCETGYTTRKDFENALEDAKRNFEEFLDPFGNADGTFEDAVYLLWSSLVKPRENLKREAVLMSKNWMNSVWSWDHAFNALALFPYHPRLAIDQFLLMFDYQKEDGRIPDFVNDFMAYWNFVKPPIHGWVLRNLLSSSELDIETLSEFYDVIGRWTIWWLEKMDYDKDGIPQYNHGNDSGWDNSTVFLKPPPIESPDLSAFLIVQMDSLISLAKNVGKPSDEWERRKEDLLKKMLPHFLNGGKLVPVRSSTHEVVNSKSLLPYMSLIASDYMPEEIVKNMMKDLEMFETNYGLSTEMPSSNLYNPDGYWRGPIWAPVTLIAHDFLRKSGHEEFAERLRKNFIRMVEKEGFAENFDALDGKGRRDRAHTWTASVYLILRR